MRLLPFALVTLLLPLALVASPLRAQEPDSTRRPPPVERPDSLPPADSLAAPQDTTGAVPADTTAPDTLAPRFPGFPDPSSRRPETVALWQQRDLMATGALSFADLIEYTPFMDPVRSGFFDGPQSEVFAGSGPGSFSYEIDGYVIAPLLGGSIDLHQIPIVELQQAKMIRKPGGYQAIGHAYRRERPEPYSRIEGATGDKGTSLLRGFLSSRAFGAPFGFAFDRIDTNGQVAGADRTFVWADVAAPLLAGVWGEVEYRGTTVHRDSFPNVSRTDWILRLRREFAGGWYTDVIAGAAKLEVPPEEPDSLTGLLDRAYARQLAVRAAKTAKNWQAYVALRGWDGEYGVPNFAPEASLELQLGPATAYATGRYTDWGDFSTAAGYASLYLNLPLRLRAFGEIERGDQGVYAALPKLRYQYGRWTAGADFRLLGDFRVGGRYGQWRVERSLGVGPPVDTISLPGGTVGVTEVWASGPVSRIFGGVLELGARYRQHDQGPFLYWPDWDWRVEGEYRLLAIHDQLQIWLKGIGGVRGPMLTPDESLGPGAASTQSNLNYWRGEAVVRIKDMYIFYNYEFFDAVGGPRDAGIQLPTQRYLFGLKWEFWN